MKPKSMIVLRKIIERKIICLFIVYGFYFTVELLVIG